MVLDAASHFREVCRGFSRVSQTTAWICCWHKDVSPYLRVFRGAFGLQSIEKGPNSRHDPGMDSATVSPVKEPLCALLLSWIIMLSFTYCLIIWMSFHTSALTRLGLPFCLSTDGMIHIPVAVKTHWLVSHISRDFAFALIGSKLPEELFWSYRTATNSCVYVS